MSPQLAKLVIEPIEKRSTPRRTTAIRGEIVFIGTRMNCVIRNISDGGAKLELACAGQLPPRFELHVCDFKPQTCNIVWCSVRELGVAFEI